MDKQKIRNNSKKLAVLVFLAAGLFFSGICTCSGYDVAQNVPSAQTIQPEVIPPGAVPTEGFVPKNAEPQGFQYSLLKFLTAMSGVLISAGAIFAGLKLYKKFVLKSGSSSSNSAEGTSLQSPKDFKEAINLFLDKTDR